MTHEELLDALRAGTPVWKIDGYGVKSIIPSQVQEQVQSEYNSYMVVVSWRDETNGGFCLGHELFRTETEAQVALIEKLKDERDWNRYMVRTMSKFIGQARRRIVHLNRKGKAE